MTKSLICFSFVYCLLGGSVQAVEHWHCGLHFHSISNGTYTYYPDTLWISPDEFVRVGVMVEGGCTEYPNGFDFKWYRDDVQITDTALVNYGFNTYYDVREPGIYIIEPNPINSPNLSPGGFRFVVIDPTYVEPFFWISLYPNPTTSDFTIRYSIDIPNTIEYTLTDISGRVIMRETYTGVSGYITKSFNLFPYAAGYYFLATKSDEWLVRKKIIKQ